MIDLYLKKHKLDKNRIPLIYDQVYALCKDIYSETGNQIKEYEDLKTKIRREVKTELLNQLARKYSPKSKRMNQIHLLVEEVVSSYYAVPLSGIKSKRQFRQLVMARSMIFFILCSNFGNYYSLNEIGKIYGGRDHSTVIHGRRKIQDLMDTYPEIRNDYHTMMKVINSKLDDFYKSNSI